MNAILRNHGTGLILTFLVGAAAGAAVALLTAPRTGRETRRKLKEFAEDLAERAGRVPSAVRAAGHDAREAFVRGIDGEPIGSVSLRDSHH